jgi:hypothetical protein
MSKDGIIAGIVSLLIIAGAVYWFTHYGPRADVERDTQPAVELTTESYATEDEFPDIKEVAPEDVEAALLKAFNEGKLLETMSAEIPGSDGDVLVLAAPTKSGSGEVIDCGIRGHVYCGLYKKSATGNRLLLWGSRLAGFAGIERFIGTSHAIIGMAWNMLNFTSVERYQINLDNGELVPKLLIELDAGDDFGELTASGFGERISVRIHGSYDRGRVVPEKIGVWDTSDERLLSELDAKTVSHFAQVVTEADDVISPIFVLPSDTDVESLMINIELYGERYVLDLERRVLEPAPDIE